MSLDLREIHVGDIIKVVYMYSEGDLTFIVQVDKPADGNNAAECTIVKAELPAEKLESFSKAGILDSAGTGYAPLGACSKNQARH